MDEKKLTSFAAYDKLNTLSQAFNQNSFHLKHLLKDKNRLEQLSVKIHDFFFDFSRQRITRDVMDELFSLAKESGAKDTFNQMASGAKVNVTENRAALHTATRDINQRSLFVDGEDVVPQIKTINKAIRTFTQTVHTNQTTGSTGKAFTDAVIVGIGGSYLGCQFVFNALKTKHHPFINLHFLSNVDIDNFGEIIKKISAETCLWIVISKSYTTTETMANLNQALLYLKQQGLDPADHLVTITAKGSPGESSAVRRLASFNMFDFIGGRYSVSSAVGALPLSLAFGFKVFEQFLSGCHKMDEHARHSPEKENIPLIAALLGIWNSNFLNYPAQAIIPYCSALSKLAPHVQQLYMESLGKGVTSSGRAMDYDAGVIIFGEPGTNAQHSFFQFAHQGRAFPIEFIGVIKPTYDKDQVLSKGVYNHQELWANMLAQAQALAVGKKDDDSARCFTGNRPSSTLLINEISAKSVGMLLAFYEARTVFEGFILGLNPFDQFGVELGKVLASDIREHIAVRNTDVSTKFNTQNSITDFYLNTLFKGTL